MPNRPLFSPLATALVGLALLLGGVACGTDDSPKPAVPTTPTIPSVDDQPSPSAPKGRPIPAPSTAAERACFNVLMRYMLTRIDEHREYPIPECEPVPLKRYQELERQAARDAVEGIPNR
ncbi:hypothetical protein AR457_10010 [Streptomyces agglomeratus]|uniref:hypothetical protein n=1 Tax=Streptomyces agglomeratus TaxID=285458 RepID=UPI0008547F7F|nr:hypothetical protein [Streptomyces agglomeratus]OEJ41236.1 hypothetical protein BGK70_26645 [Streptomyces agglomeratus]OEJ44386.1 hypothetical protein AR457_10010 [Streptomyces agglomeratus]